MASRRCLVAARRRIRRSLLDVNIHARSSRATARPSAGVGWSMAGSDRRRRVAARRRIRRSRPVQGTHARSSRATAPPSAGAKMAKASPRRRTAARRRTRGSRLVFYTYARSSRATTPPSAGDMDLIPTGLRVPTPTTIMTNLSLPPWHWLQVWRRLHLHCQRLGLRVHLRRHRLRLHRRRSCRPPCCRRPPRRRQIAAHATTASECLRVAQRLQARQSAVTWPTPAGGARRRRPTGSATSLKHDRRTGAPTRTASATGATVTMATLGMGRWTWNAASQTAGSTRHPRRRPPLGGRPYCRHQLHRPRCRRHQPHQCQLAMCCFPRIRRVRASVASATPRAGSGRCTATDGGPTLTTCIASTRALRSRQSAQRPVSNARNASSVRRLRIELGTRSHDRAPAVRVPRASRPRLTLTV